MAGFEHRNPNTRGTKENPQILVSYWPCILPPAPPCIDPWS